MHECSFRTLNFALVHNMHASRHACSSSYTRQQNERLVRACVQFKLMNVSCMHACSSSYIRQQNERLVHARVQFPMVIRHRSVVRTRKMLRAFLKTCRAVQLLHACVVKFKSERYCIAIHNGTICISILQIEHRSTN